MTHLGPYPIDSIITGDARELAQAIPDESVDLIFTDPPYLREFLGLYGDIAEIGARVLKPGGWLFAYGAGEHLPDHLARMGMHLDYFWVFILKHQNGWPRMWNKKLMSAYKPIMVYTKGKPRTQHWLATMHGDSKDKDWHDWGQGDGFALKIIDLLTEPDDVVVDFCAGGGTTPAVCKMLRRHYLAFEIDPGTAERARQRVLTTQAPLVFPEPEQLTMEV